MKMAKAPQAEIDRLMRWLQAREKTDNPPPPFMRVVFGYETLVANCCDPDKSYLEFKPEMLAAKEDKERLDWLEVNRWASSQFGKHQYVRDCLDRLREAAAGLRKNADLLDGRD